MLTRIILKCTAFIAITPSAYEWACQADIAIALLHKEDCHREMIRDAAEAVLGKFGFNITIYLWRFKKRKGNGGGGGGKN
jgi:hypothetical protein